MFGYDWIFDTWKIIQEEKVEQYNLMLSMLPVARTPMDKKGAKAINDHMKRLRQVFEGMTPWKKKVHPQDIREKRGDFVPGEMVVILDEGESPDNPLFEGMEIRR